jgi:hypothetical protein
MKQEAMDGTCSTNGKYEIHPHFWSEKRKYKYHFGNSDAGEIFIIRE